MTMVSELVLTRNQLLEIARRHEDSEFKIPLQRLSNVTAELQEGVMKTRMQPIGNAWQKLPRIVRDLAADLGKQIELEMPGAETELDRQVLDLIKDPLTHMVRNSADHGIESPDAAAGRRKTRARDDPSSPPITKAATSSSRSPMTAADSIPQRFKANAIARGLSPKSDVEKMSEAQMHRFIFAPGLHHRSGGHQPCPAAASAWTSRAPISIRSAAPSTCSRWPARARASPSRFR